jgi:hypothetical protein
MKDYGTLVGIQPELREVLGELASAGPLPAIRGTWYFVDPYKGSDANGGESVATAVKTLQAAYDLCIDGVGDGICVLSRSLLTTSYSAALAAPLTWSKWGITVFGIAAGGYNSRARIKSHAALTSAVAVAMDTTAQTITRAAGSFITDGWEVGMTGVFDTSGTNSNVTFTVSAVSALVITGTVGTDAIQTETSTSHTLCGYFPALITVSGSNNKFYNLYFINEASHVLNVGVVAVSGNRNVFGNCHFNASGTLQSAAAGQYDMRISSSECQFVRCWFGNNNTLRSGAANGNINLGLSTTQIGQNYFEDCYILSTSATDTHGAIKVIDAATLGGWVVFKRCTVMNWASGAITALATAIIGATPNNAGILLQDCGMVGYAAWGANNDKWATTNAAGAAGTGGIAGVIA